MGAKFRMKSKAPKIRVGYLVKTFPKLSEPFILREILALENEGVELQIFTLRRPEENLVHSLNAQVRAKIVSLPSSIFESWLGLVWAHLILFLTHPVGYLRALHFIARRPEPGRLKNFLQAGYLSRLLAVEKLEHLHAHFINQPAGVAELAQRMIGIPYSVTAHAKDIFLSPAPELLRKINRAKFIVTCNEYNRGFLTRIAGDGTPILRIYHGLDPNVFRADEERKNPDRVPLILSVGRLREKKGFPCLLNACRLLKVGGAKFRCVIVGYGPLHEELAQRITDLGLDGMVFLTGMLTQESLIELYKQATLFVLPWQITADGDRDGIPNVLAEAMAMELAVISTEVSGIPELIEPMRNGVLVRPEDPAGLAGAIKQLLEQPQLRGELGKAGRQKVCQLCSARDNALQLMTLFGETAGVLVEQRPTAAAIEPLKEAPDLAI